MPIRSQQTVAWKPAIWFCVCDYCNKSSHKSGKDPGDAAENARKEGFSTLTIDIADPLRWLCSACLKAKEARRNGKSSPTLTLIK